MTRTLNRTILIPYTLIVIALAQIVVWGFERQPPMQVSKVTSVGAPEGGRAFLEAEIVRDADRDCDLSFTRFMVDSKGYRYDLVGTLSMSSQAMADIERANRMMLTLRVPTDANPGPARLLLDINYVCNPVHRFWSISQVVTLPFTIYTVPQ